MQFLAFTIYYWYMFLYIGLNFLPDSTSMLSNLKILFKISPVKTKFLLLKVNIVIHYQNLC